MISCRDPREQTPQSLRSKAIPAGERSSRYATRSRYYTGIATLLLGETFERFLQNAPISVMFRALLERTIDPTEIDRLFEQTTTRQYTREILFSSIVKLMGRSSAGSTLDPRRLPRFARRDRRHVDRRLREAQRDRTGGLPRLRHRLRRPTPAPGSPARGAPCPSRCPATAPRFSTATTWPGPSTASARSAPPAPRPCPARPWWSWTWRPC